MESLCLGLQYDCPWLIHSSSRCSFLPINIHFVSSKYGCNGITWFFCHDNRTSLCTTRFQNFGYGHETATLWNQETETFFSSSSGFCVTIVCYLRRNILLTDWFVSKGRVVDGFFLVSQCLRNIPWFKSLRNNSLHHVQKVLCGDELPPTCHSRLWRVSNN